MPPKSAAAKSAFPQSGAKDSASALVRKTTNAASPISSSASSSSSASAASSSNSLHLPVQLLTLRTRNSMVITHTSRGGVRSAARLSRDDPNLMPRIDPIYTTMYYAGNEPNDLTEEVKGGLKYETKRVPDGEVAHASGADAQVSGHDAEVSVIEELLQNRFKNFLLAMGDGEVATLEFHGNQGPCDACKARITKAAELLALKMYKNTSLRVFAYYQKEAHERTRGSVTTTYGYRGDKAETYNYQPIRVKEVGTYRGTIAREAPSAATASSSSAPRANNSRPPNKFACFADSSDESDAE